MDHRELFAELLRSKMENFNHVSRWYDDVEVGSLVLTLSMPSQLRAVRSGEEAFLLTITEADLMPVYRVLDPPQAVGSKGGHVARLMMVGKTYLVTDAMFWHVIPIQSPEDLIKPSWLQQLHTRLVTQIKREMPRWEGGDLFIDVSLGDTVKATYPPRVEEPA